MREWKDSEGNKAEIVLFSEMEDHRSDNPLSVEELIGKRDDNFPLYSPNEVKHIIKQEKEIKETQWKRKSAIREILNLLTSKQKAVVVMRFWGKMKNKEIAEKLSISKPAVSIHLQRAIKKLKRYLSE